MADDAHDTTAEFTLLVMPEDEGLRLDQFLTQRHPQSSRTQIARAVSAGAATVNGKRGKSSLHLVPGDIVHFTPPELPRTGPEPERVALDVLYEDDDLAVIDKPSGMVVHPAKGHWSGTLAGALAGRYEQLSDLGGAHRPGIVHRLDRDTSGVIVVARNNAAHQALSRQFAERQVTKQYLAFTRSEPDRDRDWIDQPIAPDAQHRERMAVRPDHPLCRPARTFYEVLERYRGYSKLRVQPHTGRTHQIRVHLTHLKMPVLADPLYGHSRPVTESEILIDRLDETSPVAIGRLALHAWRLAFRHPTRGTTLEFEAPLPSDMTRLEELLQRRRSTR